MRHGASPLPRFSGGEPQILKDPRRGFAHAGEFFASVFRAATGGVDERLAILASTPTTSGNESSGVDGGFAIPPGFAEPWVMEFASDTLLPLTDLSLTDGNSMFFPNDSSAPWSSSGARAYWTAEQAAGTQVKPLLSGDTLRLHKLMALLPVSDELAADATALASYVGPKLTDAARWKFDDTIINGTGAGQPLGILNAGCLVVVAKDGSQAANTISITNCTNMYGRLPPGSAARAIWIVDASAVPALFSLGATASGYPIFYPGGGDYIRGTQIPMCGRLLGRPVAVTQHGATLSSQGDLILADLSYYRALAKTSGPTLTMSTHVYFDVAASAFRLVWRVDGQPKLAAAVSPPKGSNKLSPFITLAAR